MINLVIQLELKGKKQTVKINIPENWNEVPADVYPHLASLYMATDKQMSVYDKSMRAFSIIAWKQWRIIEQLEPAELFDLLKLIDWVFDKMDLTVNHIPEIKIASETLIGPSNGMDNLRFAEWCAAASYAAEYAEFESLDALIGLVACLYRPAGTGNDYTPGCATYRGDRREKFNDQLIEYRKQLISKVERPVLQGVFVWFASCRYQILSQYENLKDSANGDQVDTGNGWLDLYDDLRGDPKFGGAEKLEDEYLNYVLFSLSRSKEKMDELKSQYNI